MFTKDDIILNVSSSNQFQSVVIAFPIKAGPRSHSKLSLTMKIVPGETNVMEA